MLEATRITICLCAATLCGSPALAQNYPARPIKLIVPFPAGGSGDRLARIAAQEMSDGLGQPIILEYRPGAGGTIGVAAAAKAPADGYTLALGTVSTLVMAPVVQARPPYQTLSAFAPVSLLSSAPFLVVVSASVPASSLQELADLAKSKPGQVAFASNGDGTLQHFIGEHFKSLAGVDLLHVPYKGVAPALIDLLAGQIQVMFDILPAIQLQNLQTGRLRALAVASPARLPQLPGVPTTAEAGFPGLEATAWFGLITARGTPPQIVARLNAAARKAIGSRAVQQAVLAQGFDPASNSPQEFEALIAKETIRWADVMKQSGFKRE